MPGPSPPTFISESAAAKAPATAERLAADERLVRAAVGGDGEAFLEIYDRHAAGIYGYALRRLRDPSRAEDLVQDVFLALLRTGSGYRARAPLHAYLYRIAHNRVLNVFRDARPESELTEMPQMPPRHDDIVDVRTALARLPVEFREPILLATYEDLSYQEIASVLGCPIGTVRSRISRGKRMMAADLSKGVPPGRANPGGHT